MPSALVSVANGVANASDSTHAKVAVAIQRVMVFFLFGRKAEPTKPRSAGSRIVRHRMITTLIRAFPAALSAHATQAADVLWRSGDMREAERVRARSVT
jgi:hypothetical protein